MRVVISFKLRIVFWLLNHENSLSVLVISTSHWKLFIRLRFNKIQVIINIGKCLLLIDLLEWDLRVLVVVLLVNDNALLDWCFIILTNSLLAA